MIPFFKTFGFVFAAYVAAGRTGAILACLPLKYAWWETWCIAVLIDLCQFPIYQFMLETSCRYVPAPERLRQWFLKRYQKAGERLQSETWQKWIRYKPLAVMAVSGIPLRGCGILSATILAAFFKYNRWQAALWVMLGSLAGGGLTVVIFYLPLKGLIGI